MCPLRSWFELREMAPPEARSLVSISFMLEGCFATPPNDRPVEHLWTQLANESRVWTTSR
jgi:hypothetical protein